MATDVEGSDTDDHEKPGPAKRQRVVNNILPDSSSLENNDMPEDFENMVIDQEEDTRAREKLIAWQACQLAKGFVDDAINRVFENHVTSPLPSYPFEHPWCHLYHGNHMEETAISMAIRNYGLVRSLDLTQAPSLVNECILNVPENSVNMQAPTATTTSEPLSTDSEAASTSGEGDWLDDIYDSHHRRNFLDRAVAEAIKKKGLSILTLNYG